MSEEVVESGTVNGVFCDLCGSGNRQLLFAGGDRLFDIEGEFNLVKCQDCGLVYVSPRPFYEEMARFYPQDDYDLYNKAAGLTRKNMDQLGRLLGPRKGRIEVYKRPGRLLDIGFGDGSFLYFMKETGWDVMGVDYNEQMVERVREAGIDAAVGQLEDAHFADGEFDVVTLWGVLEHVQSPTQTIKEISRISGDQALLVVYTQNAAAPEARWLGRDWFIWEVPRHLYSFNPDNIARLLATGGFCVSEIVYETPLYYCQMNWQYFKERRLRRRNDVVHAPTIVDRLAVKAISIYRKIVQGRKWSSAMTVYAVKRLPDTQAASEASAGDMKEAADAKA
ncbi:MAG: class I SAM-dependent methyltransferase [Thermoleophilia bacterium]